MDSLPPGSDRDMLAQLSVGNWQDRKDAVEALAHGDRFDLARDALEIVRNAHTNLSALNSALQLLEQIGHPLVAEIAALLDSSDRDMRVYIPQVLTSLGGETAISALIGAALDETQPENVRFNAVEALGKLHASEAVQVLHGLLPTASPFLLFGIITALGEIGAPESGEILLPMLARADVAEAVVGALGSTGDARAASAVGAWIARSNARAMVAIPAVAAINRRVMQHSMEYAIRVQQAFLDALELPGVRLLGELAGADAPNGPQGGCFWRDLAEVLGWAGARWPAEHALWDGLARLLAHRGAHPAAEDALRVMLLASPDEAPSALLAAINSEYAEEAYAAARLLGYSRHHGSVPALAEALRSEDESLAKLAAESLGRIGGQPAVAALFGALEDQRPSVCQAAAGALARLRPVGLRARAEGLRADADPGRRAVAIMLLALAEESRSEDIPLDMHSDPDPAVRSMALMLLPRAATPAIRQVLQAALADPEAVTRRAAAQVAAEIADPVMLPILIRALADTDHWARLHAARALAQLPGLEGLPPLAAAWTDPFPGVRAAVVETLAGRLNVNGLPDQEKALIRALLQQGLRDPEEPIRAAAERALRGAV